MTTTTEEVTKQYEADPEDFLKRVEQAYEKANASDQARLRLFSAIGLIMNSNVDVGIKADALNHAITAFSSDIIIETCGKLAQGMIEGLDVTNGLMTFCTISMKRSDEHSKMLVNILETLTYDNDAKPAA